MNITHKWVSRILMAVLALAAGTTSIAVASAAAQYPARPLRFVVPFPPGAATDALARIIGQTLAGSIGQPVLVDNRAGAGGVIGTDLVAKAAADGHTILMTSTAHAINASLFAKLPYDPVRDFAAVTLVANLPNVLLAHAGVAARNVQELIALAKATPGRLTYASGGNGSAAHLAMELLRTSAGGLELVHVPYKGGAQALTDLMSGQVSLFFTSIFTAMPHIKSGRVRALGVASRARAQLMPELPALAESGLAGFEVVAWYGVLAPGGTPPAVINRLHAGIASGFSSADAQERLAAQGAEVVVNSPAQFAAYLRSEISKWAEVVKATGARLD